MPDYPLIPTGNPFREVTLLSWSRLVAHMLSETLNLIAKKMGATVAASVKLMYQPQPTPEVIKAFKETSIKAFSCGYNHVVALDSEKQAWSWGECLWTTCLSRQSYGLVFTVLLTLAGLVPLHT